MADERLWSLAHKLLSLDICAATFTATIQALQPRIFEGQLILVLFLATSAQYFPGTPTFHLLALDVIVGVGLIHWNCLGATLRNWYYFFNCLVTKVFWLAKVLLASIDASSRFKTTVAPVIQNFPEW